VSGGEKGQGGTKGRVFLGANGGGAAGAWDNHTRGGGGLQRYEAIVPKGAREQGGAQGLREEFYHKGKQKKDQHEKEPWGGHRVKHQVTEKGIKRSE